MLRQVMLSMAFAVTHHGAAKRPGGGWLISQPPPSGPHSSQRHFIWDLIIDRASDKTNDERRGEANQVFVSEEEAFWDVPILR